MKELCLFTENNTILSDFFLKEYNCMLTEINKIKYEWLDLINPGSDVNLNVNCICMVSADRLKPK